MFKHIIRRVFRRFAMWVVKDAIDKMATNHISLQRSYIQMSQLLCDVRLRQYELRDWLTNHETGTWADRKEIHFIRDYFCDGPNGPQANTNGVHPADRWNITSFPNRRR
jgi:hypothetical protein